MVVRKLAVVGCCLTVRLLLGGDVSYQETTKITGGSLVGMMKFASAFSKEAPKVGEPIVTTVAIKGNRMVRSTAESVDITDLDAQTMTHIDKMKHVYTVTTFEQMKQALEQGMQKAKEEQAKSPDKNASPTNPNVQVSFDAHVKKTGASKQVSGVSTNETILTLLVNGTDKTNGQQGSFGITNDMWMAEDVPGYEVVRDFQKKLAVEMGTMFSGGQDFSALVKQAQSSEALHEMSKEMGQLKGVPVMQVMRMGMSVNGQPIPAASEAPLPANQQVGNNSTDTLTNQAQQAGVQAAQETAAQEAAQKIKGAFGGSLGALGGFGGFGRKKKQQQQQQTAAPDATATNNSAAASTANNASPQSAVLIESVTEMGNFSDHVDSTMFEVPSGYKKVEPRTPANARM